MTSKVSSTIKTSTGPQCLSDPNLPPSLLQPIKLLTCGPLELRVSEKHRIIISVSIPEVSRLASRAQPERTLLMLWQRKASVIDKHSLQV